jgi:hypothetical protein
MSWGTAFWTFSDDDDDVYLIKKITTGDITKS